MGQIVFQATLGGQTALVGQNTASSYSLTLPLATDTLVGKATTDTLTNKTLTLPVISSIVNTGTLTLPTATDTLVGRATTDTLTNKTISGSSNTISNIGNSSLSNSSITIGSTSVSLGATASTIAGLTLTSPTINGGTSTATQNLANVTGTLVVGNGGTGLTSLSSGYIPYGNGTSAFSSSSSLYFSGTNLGIGTSSPAVSLDVAGNANIQNGVLTVGKNTVYDAFINTPESMYFNVDSDANSSGNLFVWGTDRAGTSGGTEWMRLTSAGYLGIGTSSPQANLEISQSSSGSTAQVLRLTNPNTAASTGAGIQWNLSSANSVINGEISVYRDSATSGTMVFKNAYASGGALTESMRIDSSGNLGLGVTPYGWYAGSSAHVFQINNGSFYADSANSVSLASNWGFTTGGAQQYISSSYATRYIQSSGQHIWNIAPSGTAGNAITFTQAMTLDNSGNLLVGCTTSGSARLRTQAVDSAGSYYALATQNSATTQLLAVRSDGYILTGLASASPYNLTTASAANLFVQTDGGLYRSTSALKYKQDIRDLELIDISKFRPIRYKSKCEGDDQTKDHIGIIADEVDQAGIKELVTYGANGEVEGFQYERLTVVLLKAIQEQQAIIEQLKQKVGI